MSQHPLAQLRSCALFGIDWLNPQPKAAIQRLHKQGQIRGLQAGNDRHPSHRQSQRMAVLTLLFD